MSIAPFILLQQQLFQQQLAEEEEENRKRKEEERKKIEEDDYAGRTSCTGTYEKIPFGVCLAYPSNMYCNIYRG